MLLGVHCSVSGGLHLAFEEAEDLGIDTFQIFTRNQRQWKVKPVSDIEAKQFAGAWKNSGVKAIFSHCSYLLNLAHADEAIHEKTVEALTEEVNRCTVLKLSFCVLHPGAAGRQTPQQALHRISAGLKKVLRNTKSSSVKIALENTAGSGSSVGGPFENLRLLLDLTGSDRIGFCLDTCHAFAQGFDISSRNGMEKTMYSFDRLCGLKNLLAFHLNDSKGALGSHLDRHEHIGHGKMTLEPFRYIMHQFPGIPKVIETSKEDDWDLRNLEVLRKL